jgi:cation transport regulator ChaC
MRRQLVFGYGSLPVGRAGIACTLRDHRRGWDVAMDNREAIPGYKYYLDAETGERPAVFVAYLSISPAPGGTVSGFAFAVSDEDLALLDRRERNYDRQDVTDLVETDLGGRVWAYVGTAAARRRLELGRERGTAVVSRRYLDRVREVFDARDLDLEPPDDLPLRTLLRRDIRP